MPIANTAKVISWNNEKDFGFAEVNGVKYYVHIGALGPVARSPIVGDVITIAECCETKHGPAIVLGVLEGVSFKPSQREPTISQKMHLADHYFEMSSKVVIRAGLIFILALLALYFI